MTFIDILLMTCLVGFSVGLCDDDITKIFVGVISLAGCAVWMALKLGFIGV